MTTDHDHALPRDAHETREALDDPIQRALLEEWAAAALRMWLTAPTFRARASYHGRIVPALFDDGGLPRGGHYHTNVFLLLRLWREFGWVDIEETRKGWDTTDDPRPSTLATYRWMSRQHDPDLSSRGACLLHREATPRQIHSMITVDLTRMAEDLLRQLDPPSLLAKSQKELAEELDAPPRVVKELFRCLTDTGRYENRLVKVAGVVKRVLVPVVSAEEEN